jgi:OmpA-OmpF porin, OOP family
MRALLGIILSLACLSTIHAQDKGVYLALSSGFGAHTLKYDLTNGCNNAGSGYLFESTIGYLVTPKWGVETGFGLMTARSTSSLDLMTTSAEMDADNDSYELRTYYKNWTEQQAMTFIGIPLNLVLRTPSAGRFRLNVTVGASLLIPIESTYSVSSGEIVTSGYYSQWDVEIFNAPRHGWLTVTDRFKGNNSLNPCLMLSESLSGAYRFTNEVEGFLGVYLQYGINNVVNPSTNEVYSNGQYHSMLESQQVKWAVPFLVGVKMGVNLYIHPKH